MKRRKKEKGGKWEISFSSIMRYNAVFCVLVLLFVMLGGTIHSIRRMESNAEVALSGSQSQISQRVIGAVNLLEALAGSPEFYDPAVPPIDKVRKLDQLSPHLGYMLMCFVDADVIVYSDGEEPASLASRDYMQQLFSTGQTQVTDSFAAGADGMTLNYTVAVPLFDEQGTITGCLFCAIYFDEVVRILEASAGALDADATLIGSRGQVMSSSASLTYGDSVMDALRDDTLFGTTADQLEEALLAAQTGSYWSIRDGSLCYTAYQRVDQTNWDILCTVRFETLFFQTLPSLLLVACLTALASIGLLLFLRRYIGKQMMVVDTLVQSIEELEKSIYLDGRPDDVDFNEVLRLTSDGLSDSLTGVVTRSVFLNQAAAQLAKADPETVKALFFVDMDNLKYINDTCGHNGGDIALKSVGYILREYEKKYDGVVGRYGGDEFLLLLTGLDDEKELNAVLEGLVLRLQTDVPSGGQSIPVQCSIGVSVYRPGMGLEQMISAADEALYYVKQNGKGYYHIHQN
ncbi:diguanylate cyclase [Clostridium sp. D33t1_170424_F3]|uniref:sensor domain-containing diguanylate cyclase n=1 Tax=Clostridium sp. D33t1_170424_F3 TaxID=2787099 RepID=UPI0018A99DCE|nr:diguanylate cyclase [Clostridium sp. D33t1_170424_F3]